MKKIFWFAIGLILTAFPAYGAELKVYPDAQLEKAEMKSLAAAQAKLPAKVRKNFGKAQIYTTADGFEKVYEYYKKCYTETDLDLKKIKVKTSTGQIVSEAYFCLDNAKSVNESKHFLKLQGPREILFKPNPKAPDLPRPPDRTLIQFTDK